MTVRYKESKSLYPLRGHPQYIDIYHLPLFNNEYKEVSPSSELFKRWTESTARWLVGRNFPLGKYMALRLRTGNRKALNRPPQLLKAKQMRQFRRSMAPWGNEGIMEGAQGLGSS